MRHRQETKEFISHNKLLPAIVLTTPFPTTLQVFFRLTFLQKYFAITLKTNHQNQSFLSPFEWLLKEV